MILGDQLEEFLDGEAFRHLDYSTIMGATVAYDGASKYVFPFPTAEMAENAIRAPDEVLRFITFPAADTWIEFNHRDNRKREGILLSSEDERLRRGTALVVQDDGDHKLSVVNDIIDFDRGGFQSILEQRHGPSLIRRFFGAILLLGYPDLIERKPVSQERLNKKRARSGRRGLADHEVIHVKLTRYERRLEEEFARIEEEEGQDRIHKRRHFVRAHLRFYRENGVLSLVKPHWRGDATLGEAPRSYVVTP